MPKTGAGPALTWGQVVGLPVVAGDMAQVAAAILALARAGQPAHVCIANVHMLVSARRDPALRRVVEQAALVVSDGQPLVWRLRRQGFGAARQVRGPDLMLEICRHAAAERVPVYFYGGDEALMAALRQNLAVRFPDLAIGGMEAAPMLPQRPEVDPATLARIRASGARIVFVGLGCPKQEFWMAAYGPKLDAVQLGVGQGFAIAAGHLPEAPRWMQRAGLEWLFRVLREPRRLWKRYLVTNSLFLGLLAAEWWAQRRPEA